MLERPSRGEIVILVYVTFSGHDAQDDRDEFHELVLSAGILPVDSLYSVKKVPEAKYLIGKGKVEEIHQSVLAHKAQLVIFNQSLTPAQTRNLERVFQCRVIDRTDLILDIFAQRAHTFEGKLQVELAQLQHLSTRLVRGWSHLERQKGGIGLRGPGETQLEVDRRLIRVRIKSITKRLEKVRLQRQQRRRARHKADLPTVALVGYTNAGKSTLFNRLSASNAYVADKLFATLDPTLRQLNLPNFGKVVIADTVGFVQDLPHDLVDAFRATLEETCDADLLLHVVDACDSHRQDKVEEVADVLKEIGAENVPQLLVYNKIDLNVAFKTRVDRLENGQAQRVWISAKTGEGLNDLQLVMAERLGQDVIEQSLSLSPMQAKLRHKLYSLGAVVSERIALDGTCELVVRLPKRKLSALLDDELSS